MVCYNICPNCGQYMYEHRCRAICARCGVFFDCEDLFKYDEVVTSTGEHILIPPREQRAFVPPGNGAA